MMKRSWSAFLFLAILIGPTVVEAGPLGKKVRSITRPEDYQFTVAQTALSLADLTALGWAGHLVTHYRPDLVRIRALHEHVDLLTAKANEYRNLVERIELGELTTVDDAGKAKMIKEAKDGLEILQAEHMELSAALNSSGPSTTIENTNKVQARTRQAQLFADITVRKAKLEVLNSVDLANRPEVAKAGLQAQLAATMTEIAHDNDKLKVLQGTFASRFGQGSIRFFGTVLGAVAMLDLGSRIMFIFIENADPGVFPAIEIAADVADGIRPQLSEFKSELNRILLQ